MLTTAIARRLPAMSCVAGLIESTTPMRNPPVRTSSPVMRFDEFGSRALRSYVGTNGRPLFALYARNTLTVTTRIVTAPTRTGLATTDVAPRPLTPAEGRASSGRVRRLRARDGP